MSSDSAVTSLDQLHGAIDELPTIPESLSRILQLLEDPNSGARDLADVIRVDAPLSAKILRLANSPLYSKSRAITTIQDCVAVLGYRTVRQVALCVSVISTLSQECDQRQSLLNYRDLWQHGVATGAVARSLAQMAKHPDAEIIFTCGLLHDLGKFVLTLLHPERYAVLMAERRHRGCRLVEIERDELGYDHAQAGAVLASAWHFPAQLIGPIGSHHDEVCPDREAGLVSLADYLANQLDPLASDLGFDPTLVDPVALHEAAGLPSEDVEERLPELREAIINLAPLRQLD